MKSIDNKLFTLFLAINIFLLTGCPNKDKTAPYITILGDNPLTVILNEQFTDPGASAQDNVDKDVSSRIVMTHNVPLLTGIQNGSG
ncbi:MAG: DUF5011 domain-containing protein, partial [Bacteroidia bacterium]|nr:DUF5011 domain-containing protein [Bacteroidia bacterium]